MSSTLRPSRPPLALTSSRQISMPSSEALPPPARLPVCAMLMPILIGGCWASTLEVSPSMATAIVPPRSVLRFIYPPDMSRFLVVYWMNKADITTKKRHVRFLTQSGHAPTGIVELGHREPRGAHLILRFGAVSPVNGTANPILMFASCACSKLMRDGKRRACANRRQQAAEGNRSGFDSLLDY